MKPRALTFLQHGKILCGKVFSGFVETWNYLTNRVENLKGDFDVQPDKGHITVDSTDPEHPIIKLVGDVGGAKTLEPWDVVDDQLVRAYWQIGCEKGECETSSFTLDQTKSKVYCTMDLVNISAAVTYEPLDDPQHFSVPVLTYLSGDLEYFCRTPVAPVWGHYTSNN